MVDVRSLGGIELEDGSEEDVSGPRRKIGDQQ